MREDCIYFISGVSLLITSPSSLLLCFPYLSFHTLSSSHLSALSLPLICFYHSALFSTYALFPYISLMAFLFTHLLQSSTTPLFFLPFLLSVSLLLPLLIHPVKSPTIQKLCLIFVQIYHQFQRRNPRLCSLHPRTTFKNRFISQTL